MENKNISFRKALIMTVVIWILVFIVWKCDSLLGNDGTKTPTRNDINKTCYYYSQLLVKEKLKSPKSAEFPSYSKDFITRNGDTVTVTAYVDADNSFGAHIRVNYIATIKVKDGETESGSVILLE